MKQLVQLQETQDLYQAEGISMVAMTYDSPELQQAFVDAQGISYPLLSDIEASSMIELGILNPEHPPGNEAYGIPYPGIFLVNRDMEIVGKIFVEGYDTRVDAMGVLKYAVSVLAD